MNLAFKSNNKTSLSKYLFLILLAMLLPTKASAQSCATVNFKPLKKNGETFLALISGHHEEAIDTSRHKNEKLVGRYNYIFAPGQHSVIVEQWPQKLYRRLKRKFHIKGKTKSAEIPAQFVSLGIIKDHHYEIEQHEDQDGNLKLVVSSITPKLCQARASRLLSTKVNSITKDTIKNSILPETLDYRLRRLMSKIATYHQNTLDAASTLNVVPVSLNGQIGTVIDDAYVNKGKALQVLSVMPYSLASNLGLASGDKITHLEGEKVTADDRTPNQQLVDYFSRLYIGQKVNISVSRNNQVKKLNGRYKPVVLPKIVYRLPEAGTDEPIQQPLINHEPLPDLLRYELNQLLVEISQYYMSDNQSQPYIKISKQQQSDTRVGLHGNRVQWQGKTGLNVSAVEDNSFAQSLGLREEDIIVQINNIELTEANLASQLDAITKLTAGDVLSLTVIRGTQHLVLEKAYQPQLMAGFSLIIDLNSVAQVTALVEDQSSFNKWRNKKYSSVGNQPTSNYHNSNKGGNSYSGGEKYTARPSSGNN